MYYHHGLRDYFASHVAADFNALDSNPAEKLHFRFALDHNMPGGNTPGNLPAVVDGDCAGGMQIAAQFSFNERATANAVEVSRRAGRQRDLAFGDPTEEDARRSGQRLS